jgi:lysozyme family protein
VTQRRYTEYRDGVGLPARDVRAIEAHEVSDIYEAYWDGVGCDALPWPACLVLMDSAVNHGTARAKRFLREVGPDPESLIKRRERFYHAIVAHRPEAKAFIKGWLRRMAHLRKEVAKHAI